jgi:hypothetical protein
MASRDLAGLLTGINSAQRPNPSMDSDAWRMAFGGQQAQNLGNSVGNIGGMLNGGERSLNPQEAIQIGMGKLDQNNIEDLKTLARMQQMRGDLEGSARTAAKIQAMQAQESKQNNTVKRRTSLAEALSKKEETQPLAQLVLDGVYDDNFSELTPLLQQKPPKGISLSTPYAGVTAEGKDIVLFVQKQEGANDRFITANGVTAPAGVTLKKGNGTTVTVDLGEETEGAFMTELGKTRAKTISQSYTDNSLVSLTSTVIDNQWELVEGGIKSGIFAKLGLTGGKALKALGLIANDSNEAETIARTEAFSANAGTLVGQIIKQFGAGTGLSDADREFANKIAAGEITLDEKAIKRLLIIQAKASRIKVQMHNKQIDKLPEGNMRESLYIEVPEFSWLETNKPANVDADLAALMAKYKKGS